MQTYNNPDAQGHFGVFGGRYVGETLMPALIELEAAVQKYFHTPEYQNELQMLLRDYVGRPTPLYEAKRLSQAAGGARIFLKREDLTHTGAHKINNTVGQALLAKLMGKKHLIAETGAGQHGVATATVAALLGMPCKVFMGSEDIERQAPNVKRMRLLGAEVVSVPSGTGTLKDAMSEALRYWAESVRDTFYVIGTVAGPHPYPEMVRNLQRVIGDEARRQFMEISGGKLPDTVMACVGGGSNAIGMFYPFIEDEGVEIIGVEAGGRGPKPEDNAASLNSGTLGVLHGSKSYVLQDENGQICEAYSISAGLDYPGVGPEHAFLRDMGRAQYVSISDAEALEAFQMLCHYEGIIPALESSHALAHAVKLAKTRKPEDTILVCLSGRGDKDLEHAARALSALDPNGC